MQEENVSSLEHWIRGILGKDSNSTSIGTVLKLSEIRREMKLLAAELAEARMELQASENKCHALKKHLEESESRRKELIFELENYKEADRNQRGGV